MSITSTFPHAVRQAARAGAALGLVGIFTLTNVGAADAHVRVLSDSSASGSFSALTFRVPNESDSAGTVKFAVQLPQDKPFLSVSSKPVPGWKVASTEEALPKPVESEGTTLTKAVRTVTWTADQGTQISPGQYQEFSLSVGPLPDPGTVLLPASQTYSDGKVVRWDEPTPASGEEPENPAPELAVTAAAATGSAVPAPESASPAPAPATTSTASSDSLARGLGVAALVVAAAGLVAALAGRRRRTSDTVQN